MFVTSSVVKFVNCHEVFHSSPLLVGRAGLLWVSVSLEMKDICTNILKVRK